MLLSIGLCAFTLIYYLRSFSCYDLELGSYYNLGKVK